MSPFPLRLPRTYLPKTAFTMVELLAVVAIIAIIAGLTIPALTGVGGASAFNGNVARISTQLDLARQYAVTQNTCVWLAFCQSAPASSNGNTQIKTAIIASKDGTNSVGWNATVNVPGSNLALVGKVELAEATGFGSLASVTPIADPESRPAQTGIAPTGNLIFKLRNPDGGADLTFDRVILFSPRGEASISASQVGFVDLIVQHMRGTISNADNFAIIQTNGFTGINRVYRP